jgi:hypothetical protein
MKRTPPQEKRLSVEGKPFVILPLTQRGRGTTIHNRAGLNWGQRDGRNKNEAYLPIPVGVMRSGILPPRGTIFWVETADGERFRAVVAQDCGKALETPDDNAILGRYFRRKLGLPSGERIEIEDLFRYGRLTVRIYKVSESLYFLDFEPEAPRLVLR